MQKNIKVLYIYHIQILMLFRGMDMLSIVFTKFKDQSLIYYNKYNVNIVYGDLKKRFYLNY